uniref:CCHC-type domain-containing protein n=1 Tax=Ananas comosus var. bracteatus TaxID=296719 RepID=A0A6V7QYA4_ANACO
MDQLRRGEVLWNGGSSNSHRIRGVTYKEALIKDYKSPHPVLPSFKFYSNHRPKQLPSRYLVNRCFRCLAKDHKASACRDPVRCIKCLSYGHRAQHCKANRGIKMNVNMNRPYHRRGREPVTKVFVPYTEEYLRRRNLRRNAVLADVLRPANLGLDPVSTIKQALARRFGGYNDDFAVARHRERDFAIFLPEWVPAEMLIRREVLTLDTFWIRCYTWGQYRDARPHRSRYQAWIRLLNLPFEIWTVPRVASIVSGFGRFVKADRGTLAMTDLRAFRCQIVLDSLLDVPQICRSSVDEESHPVMVHLESWERIEEGGGGDPPVPPQGEPVQGRWRRAKLGSTIRLMARMIGCLRGMGWTREREKWKKGKRRSSCVGCPSAARDKRRRNA